MKPIEHPFTNVTLTAPAGLEDEVSALQAYTDGQQCISCWRLSWRERLSVLVFGRVWLGVLSGRSQPPVWLWGTRMALSETTAGKEKLWRILQRLKISRIFFK